MFRRMLIFIFFAAFLLCSACDPDPRFVNSEYRVEMRTFVREISEYAKDLHPGFLIVPQNGQELITLDGDPSGSLEVSYLAAIDGVGREDLFYGFNRDNAATPDDETERMLEYLLICEDNEVEVLVTDYCSSEDKMDDSYLRNHDNGFASFAAPDRELSVIPDYPAVVYSNNQENINTLAEVRNFLYLINPDNYTDNESFTTALESTAYDLLLLDAFGPDGIILLTSQVNRLKMKPDGGRRLVLAYLSIGEAEDYRYYWDDDWNSNPPEWLAGENPKWDGNYKVEYWDPGWKAIIFGNNEAYLDRILASGFDGVYLDIIDAFEYFEEQDN